MFIYSIVVTSMIDGVVDTSIKESYTTKEKALEALNSYSNLTKQELYIDYDLVFRYLESLKITRLDFEVIYSNDTTCDFVNFIVIESTLNDLLKKSS